MATGIALRQIAPRIAERTLCIDKATHPREKTCGGGLTGHMQDEIARLGIDISDIPATIMHRSIAARGDVRIQLPLDRPFRVIRRSQLDARLAEGLRAAIPLHEGVAYLGHERSGDRLRVHTSAGDYLVKALVAADGAGSKVARSVETRRRPRVHLCQIDVPLPDHLPTDTMIYDFSAITDDLFGYSWIFPTPLDGRMANVGLMQVGSTRAGGGLQPLLARELERWGIHLDVPRVRFHPELAFDPSFAFSAPNILTVGDAAGIDPLFGEGLSQCLEYGWLAARELADSLPEDRTDFTGYRRRVLRSEMGREMTIMRFPAMRFYRPGNAMWANFIFKNRYLPEMMSRQGQNLLRLQHHVVPIAARAAWHVLRHHTS